jgi:hypothetical protein
LKVQDFAIINGERDKYEKKGAGPGHYRCIIAYLLQMQ